MSATLLIIVTMIYVGVALSEVQSGNVPMAIVFGSYALANVGLILQLK